MAFRRCFATTGIGLLLAVALPAQRPGEQVGPLTDQPDSAPLITDDLQNFRRALTFLRGRREIDTVAVLTSEYFERATPGPDILRGK